MRGEEKLQEGSFSGEKISASKNTATGELERTDL